MQNNHLTTLLRLRLLTGFLGERAQHAWWPTAFYEPSSRLFLEPVFVKTARLAQYHGVVEAARRLHDEHLNVGSFHLFRLPEEVEQDLHALMQGEAGTELVAALPLSKDSALDALKGAAEESKASGDGPVMVGQVQDLASPTVAASMAATYLSAFTRGAKAYPYLAG